MHDDGDTFPTLEDEEARLGKLLTRDELDILESITRKNRGANGLARSSAMSFWS